MAEAIKRGHEIRDVSVRLVTWFAIGLVLASAFIYLGLAALFALFKRQHPSPDAPSRIALHPQIVAPEPRLQTSPAADLERFRATEETLLHGYGWIDRPAGIIHIPIERAMDLIAQRGLPIRGPGTKNSSGITPEQMQQQKAAATATR